MGLETNRNLAKIRKGEKFITNSGETLVILEYVDSKNIIIQFEDGTILSGIEYRSVKLGQVNNPNTPIVGGVGFVGVGKYKSRECGVKTKIYTAWYSMLNRCYNENYHKKNPSYIDCLVDERWYNFQNFAKWFEYNYVDGYQLDKDILFKGNRKYSPETCVFVPQEINSLILTNKSSRGKYPLGVSKFRKGFKVNLSFRGKQASLGSYKTPEIAFSVYKEAKEQEISRVAEVWRSKITEQTYQALINYKVEIDD
jgi:hypothetical protein